MESRPKIKPDLSSFDKGLEWSGNLLLVVMWCLTVYTVLKLPGTIPIHFDAGGKPDGYGHKLTLLILPIIATIIYIGLTILNRYPQIFNYPSKITEQNAPRQYLLATRTLRFVKLAILIIFSGIILFTYLTTIGVAKGLGALFLPLSLGLLFIPTVIMILQSFRKRSISG